MDARNNSGRFYSSSSTTSSTQQPSAPSPVAQYPHDGSGSDSISDRDTSASQHIHAAQRLPLTYDAPQGPFWDQNPHRYAHTRAPARAATVDVALGQYSLTEPSVTNYTSGFGRTSIGVPFDPSIPTCDIPLPDPASSTTLYPSTLSDERNSTGSHGSGSSGHSPQGSQGNLVNSSGDYYGIPSGAQSDPLDYGYLPQRTERYPTFGPERDDVYNGQYPASGMGYSNPSMDPRLHAQVPRPMRAPTHPLVGPPLPHVGANTSYYTDHRKVFYSSPDLHQSSAVFDQTRAPLPYSGPYMGETRQSSEHATIHSGDDAAITIPDDEIRNILGLGPEQPLGLKALPDPPAGHRPGHPIPLLSQLAILGSPKKQLTLQGIYQALEERFDWFRRNHDDKSWQNSIRHNLSLYKCFRRVEKPITEPGKGSYWVVDYSRGEGTKRPRKRNKQGKKTRSGVQAAQDAKEENISPDDEDSFPSPAASLLDNHSDTSLHRVHQVGHGRTRSVTRVGVRRENSPYTQGFGPTARPGQMAFIHTVQPSPYETHPYARHTGQTEQTHVLPPLQSPGLFPPQHSFPNIGQLQGCHFSDEEFQEGSSRGTRRSRQ